MYDMHIAAVLSRDDLTEFQRWYVVHEAVNAYIAHMLPWPPLKRWT